MKLRAQKPQRSVQAGLEWETNNPKQRPMLEIDFAELSDTGRVRDHDEDFVGHVIPATAAAVRNRGWLFALADGVGGQDLGEVASRTAVESVLAGFSSAAEGELHQSLLPRLVQRANTDVHDAGLAANPSGSTMATTLVVCGLRFDRAVVCHVGDSRCYLIRQGQTRVLTSDHTVASEQARMGLLSSEEAAEATTKHVLSRSLGTDLFVNVDTNEYQIVPGDVLMLCSDGLHNSLREPDIAAIIAESPDLNAAARKLIEVANERDGSDNISVQLIKVRAVERVGMYRGRPYSLR
jgi:PPM family protein phosphatase